MMRERGGGSGETNGRDIIRRDKERRENTEGRGQFGPIGFCGERWGNCWNLK
jgi:hypothetical protein